MQSVIEGQAGRKVMFIECDMDDTSLNPQQPVLAEITASQRI